MAADGLDHARLVGEVLFGKGEGPGEFGVVGRTGGRLLGPDPPDDVVVFLAAIGVFDGKLGFSDAAEAVGGGGLARGELLPQTLKEIVAPREIGVSPVGDVPDGRQGAPGRDLRGGGIAGFPNRRRCLARPAYLDALRMDYDVADHSHGVGPACLNRVGFGRPGLGLPARLLAWWALRAGNRDEGGNKGGRGEDYCYDARE